MNDSPSSPVWGCLCMPGHLLQDPKGFSITPTLPVNRTEAQRGRLLDRIHTVVGLGFKPQSVTLR